MDFAGRNVGKIESATGKLTLFRRRRPDQTPPGEDGRAGPRCGRGGEPEKIGMFDTKTEKIQGVERATPLYAPLTNVVLDWNGKVWTACMKTHDRVLRMTGDGREFTNTAFEPDQYPALVRGQLRPSARRSGWATSPRGHREVEPWSMAGSRTLRRPRQNDPKGCPSLPSLSVLIAAAFAAGPPSEAMAETEAPRRPDSRDRTVPPDKKPKIRSACAAGIRGPSPVPRSRDCPDAARRGSDLDRAAVGCT